MTKKDSFVLYNDIRAPIEQLTMEERGELFTAILDYTEFGELPRFGSNKVLAIAFSFVQAALDRDAEKWEKKRAARSEAGKKGMESRWNGKENDNKNNNA